jgi:hypothetical protein
MKMCQFVCSLAVASALFAVASPASAQVCGTPTTSTLFAGQTIVAGTVTVFNDASNIYVRYDTNVPWVISDAHAAVAATLDGIPQTKSGNPIPGRFAYSATFDPEVTTYTFGVPSSGLFTAGQQVYVAAHAMLQAPKSAGGSQTGWAFGPDFPGANWATYVTYQVQRCGRIE